MPTRQDRSPAERDFIASLETADAPAIPSMLPNQANLPHRPMSPRMGMPSSVAASRGIAPTDGRDVIAALEVLAYPIALAGYDEAAYLRTTGDLLSTSQLFAQNPTVQAFPYYPGLAICTAGVVRLTGLQQALSKFGSVQDLSRVYDGGSLLIYDGITIVNPPPAQ